MTLATANPPRTPDAPARLETPTRLALLIGALLLPAGLVWMEGSQSGLHTIVFSLPGLLFAGLAVWKPRPWLLLTAGLVALLVPLVIFVGLFGGTILVNPLAAPEFVGGHAALAGGVLSLVAAARAFRAAKRAGSTDARPVRVVAVVLAAVFAGGALTSALAAERAVATGSGGGYDLAADVVVDVETRGYEFVPRTFQARAGDVVEFRVTNADRALHTFSYRNGDRVYEHDVLAGATTSFLARFTQPGEVEVWCRPHASEDSAGHHTGMVATLVVV